MTQNRNIASRCGMRWAGIAMVLACVLLLACSCKGERCNTPFGMGGELDLLQPDFINLYNNPGGTLVINRGHKGIIVNCIDLGQYVAFDCTCPNDHDVRMLPDDDYRAVLLTCPVCGSSYDLYFGYPQEGAASGCPLYQYQTYFDGRYLSIY